MGGPSSFCDPMCPSHEGLIFTRESLHLVFHSEAKQHIRMITRLCDHQSDQIMQVKMQLPKTYFLHISLLRQHKKALFLECFLFLLLLAVFSPKLTPYSKSAFNQAVTCSKYYQTFLTIVLYSFSILFAIYWLSVGIIIL